MAHSITKMKELMYVQEIPEDIMSQFDFTETSDTNGIIAFYNKMDELLTEEQRLGLMEELGCGTSGKMAAAHSAFGKLHKGKPLEEKIALLHEVETHNVPRCRLVGDGQLVAYWGVGSEGNYGCICNRMQHMPGPVCITPTYCGCCGAHVRKNFRRSLGVVLRLRRIISSAVSSGGKNACAFLFDIVKK